MNSLRFITNVAVGTCLVGLLHLQHVQAEDDPRQVEVTELEGTWEVVSLVVNGEQKENDSKHWRFEGNRLSRGRDDDEYWTPSGTFSVDPSAMPAEIEFVYVPCRSWIRTIGIYEMDDELLTMRTCSGQDFESGVRPDSFESTESYRTVLMSFRRVEEDDE